MSVTLSATFFCNCNCNCTGLVLVRRTWRPTENYLVQFTGEQLSDPELYNIWDAYDINGDGKMDREELSFLMEDLCEASNTQT